MVKDNQDYFKRAGRSGGPAGPLHQFRQKFGQERAVLSRGEERGFPGHRPPTYHPPGEPPEIRIEPPHPGRIEGTRHGGAQEGRPEARGNGHARDEEDAGEGTVTGVTGEPRIARPSGQGEPHHTPQTETQSFGPPADYDAAVGHGPGTQEISPDDKDFSAVYSDWATRNPRPFRVASWIGRRLEAPAGRAISLARRLKRTLDDVRR